MVAKRRLGTERSASRSALLDAVEEVMRNDGYGALTARSVAEQAGLKHQLVFYYFQAFDDLLIATYDRHIGRYLQRIEEAMLSNRPLHALWRVHADPVDATLNMEFLALANHNQGVRARTIEFGEKVRQIGIDQLEQRFHSPPGGGDAVTPFAVIVAITSIGSILGLETALGISGGHPETLAMVEWCVDQLEPDPGKD